MTSESSKVSEAGPDRGVKVARAALLFASAGTLASIGAVCLYQEPQSFYTNFVLWPALTLLMGAVAAAFVAAPLALIGLWRGERRHSPRALALAFLAPSAAAAFIIFFLKGP